MYRHRRGWLSIVVVALLLGCAAPAAPGPRPAATATTGAPSKPAPAGGSAVPAAPTVAAVPSPPAAPETVRIAHAPSTLFAPLYVAIEKGYLAEQGITPQLEVVTAGQDAMALAAQGQLDLVVGGFGAATFNAIDRGLEIRVVGSMGAQPQTGFPSALMVRRDLLDNGQVRSVADLKGRKVALAGGAGSTGSYWIGTKLREANLTLGDIDIVNMGFPDMIAAFKSAAVDAAFPPAPFTTQIIHDNSAENFGGPIRPGASAVGTVYGTSFMRDRDATARRFFVAIVRGARDVQGDSYYSDENLEIFSKYTRLGIDVLRDIDQYAFDPDLKPDVETLMDMQRLFQQAGIIVYNPPLPPERVADESYSRAAAANLGPYRPR
jgi:NitT/TauT family transport system substrate-binding protein